MLVLFFDPSGQELRRHGAYLATRGVFVHAHADVTSAISAAESDLPDAIVAVTRETSASDDPALDVCRAIAANPFTRNIPLVLLSARPSASGPDDPAVAASLHVPCEPGDLYARIKVLQAPARFRNDRSLALRAAAARYRVRRQRP